MTASPQIRLALIITELDLGGAERCLTNIALGLGRRDFEPKVFVLASKPIPPRDGLLKELLNAGVPVEFLGFAQKWKFWAAVRSLRRCLREYDPDVVQSMLFHANVVARLAVPPKKRPCWCTGIRVADPSWFRQVAESRAISVAGKVVCVSDLVSEYAASRLSVPTEKLVSIPNGVDIHAAGEHAPANLQALGVASGRKAITCIARLHRQKGIDHLLSVAGPMLEPLPDHDLLLVGDGPHESILRKIAAETRLGDRIHFCGWHPDSVGILKASQMLVLPSRWEGMPNVLLEAMACSLPVVCTAVEGVVEVLGPLAERQTVAPAQPQAFARQVVEILSDPNLANQLGVANRQQIEQHFSLEQMLERYEALYQGL